MSEKIYKIKGIGKKTIFIDSFKGLNIICNQPFEFTMKESSINKYKDYMDIKIKEEIKTNNEQIKKQVKKQEEIVETKVEQVIEKPLEENDLTPDESED
jgi:hypothetical protein